MIYGKDFTIEPLKLRTKPKPIDELKGESYFNKMRLLALERDNYICQICGSPASEVHHIDHNRSNNNLENLQTLCVKHNRMNKSPYEKHGRNKFTSLPLNTIEGRREYHRNYNLKLDKKSRIPMQHYLLRFYGYNLSL